MSIHKERGVILGITELDKLQELARLATREALENYEIPDEWKERLSLGIFFEDDDRIFELYVTGDKPDDAIVISRASVNRNTKDVSVVISNLEKKAG